MQLPAHQLLLPLAKQRYKYRELAYSKALSFIKDPSTAALAL